MLGARALAIAPSTFMATNPDAVVGAINANRAPALYGISPSEADGLISHGPDVVCRTAVPRDVRDVIELGTKVRISSYTLRATGMTAYLKPVACGVVLGQALAP